MFLIRLIKHLLLLFLVSLPLVLIGILITPIILLCIGDNPKFPVWLNWFDNADHWLGRDTSTYDAIITQGFAARYWFIAFQNPTNLFGYRVLGVQVKNSLVILDTNNQYLVGDGAGNEPGYLKQEVLEDLDLIYEYYYILKWNSTHCLRFRMGWKIGNPEKNKIGDYIENVFVFQPYKAYSGK